MLIFLSDLHLSDSASTDAANQQTFRIFITNLSELIQNADAKEVEIVLLGDAFDIIRSEHWLTTEIRPWSHPTNANKSFQELEDHVLKILNAILAKPGNAQAINALNAFRAHMISQGVNVRFTYIIGNHDWLINRYPSARDIVSRALKLPASSEPFPEEKLWPELRVFARHGDIHDRFNHEKNRDASSLGDAIVIELLNKFPEAVRQAIGPDKDPDFIAALNEIDNLRPVFDAPQWIEAACHDASDPSLAEIAKKEWNHLVDKFLETPFVRNHDKILWPDLVDLLQIALKITKGISLDEMAALGLRKLDWFQNNLETAAAKEPALTSGLADFIVYGHTHKHAITPINAPGQEQRSMRKIYFNTGAWRKIHVGAPISRDQMNFTTWRVMTFIAFYNPKERANLANKGADIQFEAWNGALG
jgi:UDP-2,3-diacylglucosamine pyrophosphatase LpxH